MLDWLLDPFAGGIMQRALAELILLSLVCGPLGVWVILYRQAYAAESIAHGMLPGLVLAAIAGAPFLLGAGGGVLLAAAAIAVVARHPRLDADVGVAVAVGSLTGAGALLALAAERPPGLAELLFGDPLGVSPRALAATGILVAVLLSAMLVAHRGLAVSAFDPPAARSLGGSPARAQLTVLVLIGVTTVAAVQVLGNLLAVALVLAPAAGGMRLAPRLKPAMAVAAALGIVATVAGLLVSFHFDVAAGAAVALSAVFAWSFSSVVAIKV